MTAVLEEVETETPSDWLLAQFDLFGNGIPWNAGVYVRPLYQLIDDSGGEQFSSCRAIWRTNPPTSPWWGYDQLVAYGDSEDFLRLCGYQRGPRDSYCNFTLIPLTDEKEGSENG